MNKWDEREKRMDKISSDFERYVAAYYSMLVKKVVDRHQDMIETSELAFRRALIIISETRWTRFKKFWRKMLKQSILIEVAK